MAKKVIINDYFIKWPEAYVITDQKDANGRNVNTAMNV